MSQFVGNLKENPSFLVGFAILLACLIFGIIRSNQLTRLSVAEAELNTKLDKISFNIKNSEGIDQDIEALEELVGNIDERLFVSEERSTNIDYFYSFEKSLNIVISEVEQSEESSTRFSKDGPDELKLYSVVDYNITVNGSFHEILRFMYEIYQNDSIMRVSDFQMNATTDKNSESSELLAKVRVAVLATK